MQAFLLRVRLDSAPLDLPSVGPRVRQRLGEGIRVQLKVVDKEKNTLKLKIIKYIEM